jgi:hypothetical protein
LLPGFGEGRFRGGIGALFGFEHEMGAFVAVDEVFAAVRYAGNGFFKHIDISRMIF